MPVRPRYIAAVLLALLLLLTLAFIFGNSLKPADASNAQSGGFIAMLGRIFGLSPAVTENEGFRAVVRTLAHFCEFALLGAEVAALLLLLGAPRIAHAGGGLFVILVAVSDECIQRFVPGRTSDILDVAVDSAGGLFGLLLVLLAFFLFFRPRAKKHEGEF